MCLLGCVVLCCICVASVSACLCAHARVSFYVFWGVLFACGYLPPLAKPLFASAADTPICQSIRRLPCTHFSSQPTHPPAHHQADLLNALAKVRREKRQKRMRESLNTPTGRAAAEREVRLSFERVLQKR